MNDLVARTPGQLQARGQIDNFENVLRNSIEKGEIESTIADCKRDNSQAKHYYGEGVYARSLLIPAGTAVVGYIHKQDRVCIIAGGKCTFADEFHSETVEAPWVGEFKAGTKTAVYAHTDTTWVAVVGTDDKDADILTDKLVVATYEEYEQYVRDKQCHSEQ